MPDGRILIVGVGTTQGVVIYNPATESYTPAANLPTARTQLALATGSDGRVYAIGGMLAPSAGFPQSNEVDAYNPATNTWTVVASMPTARFSLGATTGPDGRIYAIGGAAQMSVPPFAPIFSLSTVEVYNPATNTWTAAANLQSLRDGLAAATGPNGLIYAIGGFLHVGGTVLNSVEQYSPATNKWSFVANVPTGRLQLAAATGPDGLIYAIGGATQDPDSFPVTGSAVVEAYSATSNTWSTASALPVGRFALGAATGGDKRIHAFGGLTGNARAGGAATAEVDALFLGTALLRGTPTQRFVTQLYSDLLGRVPEASGLAFFTGLLDSGAFRREQVAGLIEASTEFRTLVVQQLYRELLNRPADALGLSASLAAYGAGAHAEDIEGVILGSTEYFGMNGGTNQAFLQALYLDVLERPLDTSGSQYFGGLLTAGTSRTTVSSLVLHSTEADTLQVRDQYFEFLRRPADQGSLNLFVAQLQQGLANEQLAAFLLGSPEYLTLVNMTVDQRYVASLYQSVLGRPGSAAEIAGWANLLDQGVLTTAQVSDAIQTSTEGRTQVVQQIYQRYLRRSADSAGLASSLSFLSAGGRAQQLVATLLGSPEYFTTRGGGTNTGFVTALYLDTLNRAIDSATQTLLLQALANGTTRSQVAQVVVSSQEYAQVVVQGLYSRFLARAADQAGLNQWVALLQQGGRVEQVITGLVTSAEYFNNLVT